MRAQRTGRGRQERRVSSLANAAALRVLAAQASTSRGKHHKI